MRLRKLLLGISALTALVGPISATHLTLVAGASPLQPCASGALWPTVGRSSGAAGTTYETLLMKNRSSVACTLAGTPATQFGNFVASGGLIVFKSVGPAASKTMISTRRGQTITVKPGATASVTVGIATAADYAPAKCHKALASRVRLVFASGATLYYTLLPATYSMHQVAVCTKLASTTTFGVVLGTRFP